jgi:hypothetical protein
MPEVQDGHYDSSTDSLRVEPIYESFLCPLTKQIMRDPVTLETGSTFERQAILKWFKESDSIALKNTIDEWMHRNEAAKLDVARKLLTSESSESDTVQALEYVAQICQRSRSSRHVVRNLGLISLVSELLKNSSTKIRQKALESLRFVAKDDNENKVLFYESSFFFCVQLVMTLVFLISWVILHRMRLLPGTTFVQL